MHSDAALTRCAANGVHEARLADAGFAAYDDRAAMTTARASVQRREDHRQLRSSADEWLGAGADLTAQSFQVPGNDGLGVTGPDARSSCAADPLTERCAQFFGDENLIVGGARCESVCNVRRPACQRKDFGAAQHLPLRDADAQRE
jgi:hypothetical protein